MVMAVRVLGWPFFHGLASAVNPKIGLKMVAWRGKGAPYCDHLFEIGEERLIPHDFPPNISETVLK